MQGTSYSEFRSFQCRTSWPWSRSASWVAGPQRPNIIFKFLEAIVGGLLVSISTVLLPWPNSKGADVALSKWNKKVQAGPEAEANETWLSANTLQTDQPFSKPPTFDIDEIIAHARSQADAAQDELWLLQTDPACFHKRAMILAKERLDTVPEITDLSPETTFDDIAIEPTWQFME